MNQLAIIGNLGTNSADHAANLSAVSNAVDSLHTPAIYWVVVIVGVIASRWLVRPSDRDTQHGDWLIYIASAILFLIALLAYLHIRNKFIDIFAELTESVHSLLIMPMLLGSSPIGAVLLILSWYYFHPIARRPNREYNGIISFINLLMPMAEFIIFLGSLILVGLFLRLI